MPSEFIQNMFGLDGQTAIISGGTGGLGSAMVVALVEAGVSVVHSLELPDDPASVELKNKVEKHGGKVVTHSCDYRDSKAIRRCFQEMWDAGVVPDILLNSAGVIRRNPCESVTDEEIDLIVDVNLKAVYISAQEFGRRLLSLEKPGKIINVASVTAYQANLYTSIYSATKGGVVQMTKAFSNEWSSKGIQVNCIAPGFMKTPMTMAYQENPAKAEFIMKRVPMGRWGYPEDLQATVLYLAAPGNKFTTGTCLIVDGGLVAM